MFHNDLECNTEDCIICLQSMNINQEIWVCPQCNIKIHQNCIYLWLSDKNYQQKKCPHCKFNIILPEYDNTILENRICNLNFSLNRDTASCFIVFILSIISLCVLIYFLHLISKNY